MTTRDPSNIDWAKVAARARADLGSERVARFSERLRKAMNVTEGERTGSENDDARFGESTDIMPHD